MQIPTFTKWLGNRLLIGTELDQQAETSFTSSGLPEKPEKTETSRHLGGQLAATQRACLVYLQPSFDATMMKFMRAMHPNQLVSHHNFFRANHAVPFTTLVDLALRDGDHVRHTHHHLRPLAPLVVHLAGQHPRDLRH